MSKKSNSFLSFLTGAAAGAILGILYAPDKGENTRDKLSYQLDKYSKKLDDLVKEFVEGKELSENEAKSEGEKIVSDAKEKAEKLLDDVNGLITKIKSEEV
ncbi:YtxH domain-containing protein [Reichenbachiella carrageenanivorans]|uniref:YtxH domain-containing protein n=1 Tax=Reichenbachiella carrageenanivorans TaxID=2979869 RepID=A0ABY6D1S8_9BACT|nr:YtxH domain-containing protein [Reichenbachiella carrageenanivorans]UXX80078.1 YtxH domain-containing protein [Reichenbachiella carrageenanivorans]